MKREALIRTPRMAKWEASGGTEEAHQNTYFYIGLWGVGVRKHTITVYYQRPSGINATDRRVGDID